MTATRYALGLGLGSHDMLSHMGAVKISGKVAVSTPTATFPEILTHS